MKYFLITKKSAEIYSSHGRDHHPSTAEWACSRIALRENLELQNISFLTRPLRICIGITCVCEMIGLEEGLQLLHCTILAAMHDLLSHNKGAQENVLFYDAWNYAHMEGDGDTLGTCCIQRTSRRCVVCEKPHKNTNGTWYDSNEIYAFQNGNEKFFCHLTLELALHPTTTSSDFNCPCTLSRVCEWNSHHRKIDFFMTHYIHVQTLHAHLYFSHDSDTTNRNNRSEITIVLELGRSWWLWIKHITFNSYVIRSLILGFRSFGQSP